MVKYDELVTKPSRFVAMTGMSVEEFQALVPHFEAAWLRYVDEWNLDGRRRVSRDYSRYQNTPLPRAEDKLLFIVVYLKQATTQEVQGQLFGMTQSNVNKWIHLLHPVVNQALAAIGELPAQTAGEFAQQVSEQRRAAAGEIAPAAVEASGGEPSEAANTAETDALTRVFFCMTALNDQFNARNRRRTKRTTIAARKSSIA